MKHKFVRLIYLFHNILFELKQSCVFYLNEIRASFSDFIMQSFFKKHCEDEVVLNIKFVPANNSSSTTIIQIERSASQTE